MYNIKAIAWRIANTRVASKKDTGIYVDLDNTLIYATEKKNLDEEKLAEMCSKLENVDLNLKGRDYLVVLRPGAREFLEEVNRLGHVRLCTSATRSYADEILNQFDLARYFEEIISREDLNSDIIKEKYLNTILVDDLRPGTFDIQSKLKTMGVGWSDGKFYQENPDKDSMAAFDAEMAHYQAHHVKIEEFYGRLPDNELSNALSKVKALIK